MTLKESVLLIAGIFGTFLTAQAVSGQSSKDYTRLVDPMIGTNGHGHTFPGATLPFGMIQLSPDTRTETWDGCSGYHYSDKAILGFSHTHFSGTGVGSGADILLMPVTGNFSLNRENQKSPGTPYSAGFTHENEFATPGYYRVRMENGIQAELTCTERVGFHRYTFRDGKEAGILLDLSHGITSQVDSLSLEVVNKTTLTGFRHAHSSLDGDKTVWFVIQFSVPFEDCTLIENGNPAGSKVIFGGKDLKAHFRFNTEQQKEIRTKVALSRVDKSGAINNLEKELPDWDFDAVKESARNKWQKELAVIEVEGGTTEQQRTFYTALYHCFVHPNIAMDADRRFFGTDHKIHLAADFDNYTTFSLWDTFRALHPLFTIINQQKTNQFIRSFIERYQHFGTMMIMEFGGNEGFGMIGYHALSVIADAYVKGIRDYDVNLAFKGMKDLSEGLRAGKEIYKRIGYIPYESEDQSVSRTLEYAYDDWCVSRLAKDLNLEDFRRYSQKGNFYQNLFCQEVGFMRGKSGNYRWQQPFDPKSTANFTEGNAYQFSLFVPQDFQGLFKRMGGDRKAEQWLDRCFSTEMDANQARTGDMTGNIGQYVHGNEPSHHMAYLYNYLGKPWKSQERVRQIMENLYTDQPDGLCGNEDAGQMSAWFVLSAMGFYSTTPGMDYYVMGSPLFKKVTLHLENGKQFIIKAPDADRNRPYVISTTLNGRGITRSYLRHADIIKGGELVFGMAAAPDYAWGSKMEDRPYSESYPTPLPPKIETTGRYFKDSLNILISCEEAGAEIRYSLDGTEPTTHSALYTAPFSLNRTATLKTSSFSKNTHPSFPVSATFTRLSLRKATSVERPVPGLLARYFEGYCVKLADMKQYPVRSTTTLPKFDTSAIKDDRSFGYYFDGYLYAPASGVYSIFVNSNDGSSLTVDGKTEIINDGFHRAQERECKIELEKGFHSIGVDYFQMGGAKALKVSWAFENGPREELPPEVLFHE